MIVLLIKAVSCKVVSVLKTNAKYVFIHPTKTAGTSVEKYFKKYYQEYINGIGHNNICKDYDNPIIIIRNPFDRFISSYKYWKNGGTRFRQTPSEQKFIKNIDTSINNYIKMIFEKSPNLNYSHYLWEDHYKKQSYWLKPRDYSKTIVILYDKTNMKKKINTLLKKLNIPNKNKTLEKINKTLGDKKIKLTEKQKAKDKKINKDDFDLWYKLLHQKNLFKKII